MRARLSLLWALIVLPQALLPAGSVICFETCGAWEITTAHAAHACAHSTAACDDHGDAADESPAADPHAGEAHAHDCGGHGHAHEHSHSADPTEEFELTSSPETTGDTSDPTSHSAPTDATSHGLEPSGSPCTDLRTTDLLATSVTSAVSLLVARLDVGPVIVRATELPHAPTPRALRSRAPDDDRADSFRAPIQV